MCRFACKRVRWALAVVVLCASAGGGPLPAQLVVRETSLGVRPEGMVLHTIEVSAAMRLGYVVETSAGDAVVVDGVRGRLYSDIDTRGGLMIARELRPYFAPQRRPYLTFSPDGKRFVSAAKKGEQALVVVDGRDDAMFDAVFWDLQPFSPDSRHVAYLATREGSYVAVRDGVVGRAYDAIRSLTFTPDSRHVVYIAQRDGREYVVMDGKEVGAGERILGTPTVTAAGERLAYKVKKGDSVFGVVDGKLTSPGAVDSLFGPSFSPRNPFPATAVSPDGRRTARIVGSGATWFAAIDGVTTQAYDDVRYLTFSPDSRHLAHVAKRRDKWMIVVDGAESPVYDEIVGFPTSDQVGGDSLTVLARRGAEDFRVSIPWPKR